MSSEGKVRDALERLQQTAPAGYALAFHIEFTTPTFLFQTYPKEWLKAYSEGGFVMSDPTVHWGFENEGTVRWSELADNDVANVLGQAASHGMAFGLTCSVNVDGTRSFASFSRTDREFTNQEAAELLTVIKDMHHDTAEIKSLSPETTQALRKMSVEVTSGGTR